MKSETLTHQLMVFFKNQISDWDSAYRNYEELKKVEKRSIKIDIKREVILQYNPKRIVSTISNSDHSQIKRRPCFLCKANREDTQKSFKINDEWEILVNPFPIFNPHFTIVSKEHKPQKGIPKLIFDIAGKLPGFTIFMNGSHAGASAPDHLHLQAVKTTEIPFLKICEIKHFQKDKILCFSEEIDKGSPFNYLSFIFNEIEPQEVQRVFEYEIDSLTNIRKAIDEGLYNFFCWKDSQDLLRALIIPRSSHRPSCYFKKDSQQRLVSPGCIDMGGVIITPRKEDFLKLNREEIIKIYEETGIKT